MGANQDFAFGFAPHVAENGQTPDPTYYPLRLALTGTQMATKIYKGQFVKMNGTSGWVRGVTTATDCTNLIGVAAAYFGGSNSTQTWLPAWEFRRGADQKWLVQASTSLGANAASFLGHNAGVTGLDDGTTSTGYSSMELSAEQTTGTGDNSWFRIVGVSPDAGGSRYAVNTEVIVRINEASTNAKFTLAGGQLGGAKNVATGL